MFVSPKKSCVCRESVNTLTQVRNTIIVVLYRHQAREASRTVSSDCCIVMSLDLPVGLPITVSRVLPLCFFPRRLFPYLYLFVTCSPFVEFAPISHQPLNIISTLKCVLKEHLLPWGIYETQLFTFHLFFARCPHFLFWLRSRNKGKSLGLSWIVSMTTDSATSKKHFFS